MKPAKLRYVRAETAEHAVELLLGADGSPRILAGGQSLIPALNARSISASLLVDIIRCSGLGTVSRSQSEVTVGAACRQSRIERDPEIQAAAPLLAEALGWVAMPQVRSRGTVVGCLAQANPGGEIPVVALALDAQLNVLSENGARSQMPAADVYAVETGTKVPPNTLIESASFRSRAPGEGWGFFEVQLRPGHFALVCCAATLLVGGDSRIRSARIAIGGLTASPYRAYGAEKALVGENVNRESLFEEASRVASEERPWPARSDLHATDAFRSKAAIAAVARALADARRRCSKSPGGENGVA